MTLRRSPWLPGRQRRRGARRVARGSRGALAGARRPEGRQPRWANERGSPSRAAGLVACGGEPCGARPGWR
eukprot:529411-Lingulodinium_polyedra.AAC.1